MQCDFSCVHIWMSLLSLWKKKRKNKKPASAAANAYAQLSDIQVGNHIQPIWLLPLSTEIIAAIDSGDSCLCGVSARADLRW